MTYTPAQFRAAFTRKAKGRTQPKRDGSMNRTEAAYAQVLESRRLAGEIASWQFQPVKLRLADRTFYEPDFMVILSDGTCQFHETKAGVMNKGTGDVSPLVEDDAMVKIKVAAEQHPFEFVMAFCRKGEWHYRSIG